MNFTLDDSSPELRYSSHWAVQAPASPDLDRFFLQTYHVAQASGATLNITFAGSAIVLFGSVGPNHANFSVQYDDDITYLSAYAPQTDFQQPLFSASFADGDSAAHIVSLTALLDAADSRGTWLDFDFVQISNGSTSTTTAPVATVVPPWQTSSFASSSAASSPAASTSTAAAPSAPSKAPTVLAALFGSVLALILAALGIHLLLVRLSTSQRARERRFRYGRAPTGAPRPSTSVLAMAQTEAAPALARPSEAASDASAPSSAAGYVRVPPVSPPPGSTGSAEADSVSPVRAFLNTSPLVFKKQHKGDADSLRTDFLQV